MKRFEFRLDRVRRWREEQASIEELKLRQLHDALASLREQRGRVASERAENEHAVLSQPSIEACQVQSLEIYRRYAAGQIHNIAERERQCEEHIREQSNIWREARQKAELLERLKQKTFEEWRAASDREEENLASELFLAKRMRR